MFAQSCSCLDYLGTERAFLGVISLVNQLNAGFSLFLDQCRKKSDNEEIQILWLKEVPDPYSLIPRFISDVKEIIQAELETLFRERNLDWKNYILVESINI